MNTDLMIKVNNYNTGYLIVEMDNCKIDCIIKSGNLKIGLNKKNIGFFEESLDFYSVDKLKEISFIILNAYLFSQKQLIEFKYNKSSVELIEKQKEMILKIREILNIIIDYINNYDSKIDTILNS